MVGASHGLLLDANVLLLWVVGLIDRKLIERFKRTADRYQTGDFDILVDALSRFPRRVTTAHVLTEVSNLAGQIKQVNALARALVIARVIDEMHESTPAAKELAQRPAFRVFGLTDAAIDHAARQGITVLTDDGPLASWLVSQGLPVINFNHLRF
jgi:rRNA-processing protein FCF1